MALLLREERAATPSPLLPAQAPLPVTGATSFSATQVPMQHTMKPEIIPAAQF